MTKKTIKPKGIPLREAIHIHQEGDANSLEVGDIKIESTTEPLEELLSSVFRILNTPEIRTYLDEFKTAKRIRGMMVGG